MKKVYLLSLSLVLLSSQFVQAQEKDIDTISSKSSQTYFSVNIGLLCYPFDVREVGLSLYPTFNNKSGLALNARYAFNKSTIQIPSYGRSVNDGNLQFALRYYRIFALSPKINFISEFGAAYSKVVINEVNYHVTFTRSANYFDKKRFNLPGISIVNRIQFSEVVNLYLHHNINAQYSYTSLGLQIDFNRKVFR